MTHVVKRLRKCLKSLQTYMPVKLKNVITLCPDNCHYLLLLILLLIHSKRSSLSIDSQWRTNFFLEWAEYIPITKMIISSAVSQGMQVCKWLWILCIHTWSHNIDVKSNKLRTGTIPRYLFYELNRSLNQSVGSTIYQLVVDIY